MFRVWITGVAEEGMGTVDGSSTSGIFLFSMSGRLLSGFLMFVCSYGHHQYFCAQCVPSQISR